MERVRYETFGRVARVTMNRPEVRNAQSRPLLRDLDAAFAQAADDPAIRVIVLAGAGKDFSSGHDLGTPEMEVDREAHPRKGTTDAERNFDYSWEHFLDMSLRWRDLPKATIAQVHGWCIFGGWILASAMDLVVASEDARFMTNLLQFFTLPWEVGPKKAKEILFDNEVIGAEQAQELGFVNHVWPRDELADKTLELAQRIAGQSSFWLRLVKLSVNGMQDAAGFRAAVQAAHSNYQLSEIHLRMREAERRAEGKEGSETQRLGAVDRMLRRLDQE